MAKRTVEMVLTQLKQVRLILKTSEVRERRLHQFVHALALHRESADLHTIQQARQLLADLYPAPMDVKKKKAATA